MLFLAEIPQGVEFQTVLTMVLSAVGALAAVIAVLWKSLLVNMETVKEDKRRLEIHREESDKIILSLVGKVGSLEGKTQAYTEVNDRISRIDDGIQSLSDDVLDALKGQMNDPP